MKRIKRRCWKICLVLLVTTMIIPAKANQSDIFYEEERASFLFLREHTNTNLQSPGYGLSQDRSSDANMASISATGFSLSALAIGVENGWMSYEEGYASALETLKTLAQDAQQLNGFYYHFLDINNAQRFGTSEVSGIDTAILVSNAMFVGEYFQGEVKQIAQTIYDRVNWNWYRNDNNRFSMGYQPESGFVGEWDSYAEQMMMYFLGAASSTHPIPSDMLYNLDSTVSRYDDFESYHKSHVNALFAYQYSHAFFDMRNMVDKQGTDWFQNSRIATLVSRQFSIDTRNIFDSHSETAWGLTASDGPFGYQGNYGAQFTNPNDGTIAPCGAAGSAPFASDYVKETLNNYRTIDNLWGTYGFKDAFNTSGDGYVADEYLSIDKGISMLMLENARSGLVWNTLGKNKQIQKGMKLVGMHGKDTTILADGDIISTLATNGTMQLSQAASKGNTAFHIVPQAGSDVLQIDLPVTQVDDVFALDIKGIASDVKLQLFDESQVELFVSPAQTVQNEDYQTLYFDLSSTLAMKPTTIRISLTSSEIYVDELRLENRETMVHNVSITQKPYVGGTSEVLFDTIVHEEVSSYEYEWSIASQKDGSYKVVSNEASFTPDASHANQYLNVLVTPIGKSGIKGQAASVKNAMYIHPQMPEVSASDRETIIANQGKSLDDTSLERFDLAQNWQSNSGVYAISETPFKANFDKQGNAWAFAYRPFTTNNLSKYKALHMDVTTDSNFILKFETLQNGTYVSLEEIAILQSGVYEWDMSMYEEMLKQADRILLFAAPGDTTKQGSITFNEFYFASEVGSGDKIYPDNVSDFILHEYDGSENFSFNQGWFEKGDTYRIQPTRETATSITYQKQAGKEKESLRAYINGNFADVQTMRFVLQGSVGTTVSIQSDVVETELITLSGEEDLIEIDMSTLSIDEKNKLSYIDLIVEPDSSNASGELRIHKAQLSKQKIQYTINASAAMYGSISDAGLHSVSIHEDKTYIIKAFFAYQIKDVLVDGKSIGAVETYIFKNIQDHHVIEAVFEKIPFTEQLPELKPEPEAKPEVKPELPFPSEDVENGDVPSDPPNEEMTKDIESDENVKPNSTTSSPQTGDSTSYLCFIFAILGGCIVLHKIKMKL